MLESYCEVNLVCVSCCMIWAKDVSTRQSSASGIGSFQNGDSTHIGGCRKHVAC